MARWSRMPIWRSICSSPPDHLRRHVRWRLHRRRLAEVHHRVQAAGRYDRFLQRPQDRQRTRLRDADPGLRAAIRQRHHAHRDTERVTRGSTMSHRTPEDEEEHLPPDDEEEEELPPPVGPPKPSGIEEPKE